MSSLLPNNATSQERDIEASISRVLAVPVELRKIWNPDTCPDVLLPWLAWSFSVDTWSSAWTEEKKRETIKNSIYVHKRKGTIGAVRQALENLGYLLEVIEWFQEETPGDPYTFRVVLNGEYEPINTDLYEDIVRVIRDTKNVRSFLARITVERDIYGVLQFPGAAISGETTAVYPL